MRSPIRYLHVFLDSVENSLKETVEEFYRLSQLIRNKSTFKFRKFAFFQVHLFNWRKLFLQKCSRRSLTRVVKKPNITSERKSDEPLWRIVRISIVHFSNEKKKIRNRYLKLSTDVFARVRAVRITVIVYVVELNSFSYTFYF